MKLIIPQFFAALILALFLPVSVLADMGTCSQYGYTILSINGVSTDEGGAIENKKSLETLLLPHVFRESIKVDFLLNPSHVAGVLDVADAVRQKVFNETSDYDLVEMLNDASDKITTQKVLLVAHSQGNFYANNFYDTVVNQSGGIPSESIGVYGVASPSDRVAGGGMYLTSSTDNVINTLRTGGILNILKANTDIVLPSEDTALGRGHSFSDVYIPNRGARIVADIQESLSGLSADPERREDVRCLDPQELSIAHKTFGAALLALDGTADGLVYVGGSAYAFGTAVGKSVQLAREYTENLITRGLIYSAVALVNLMSDTTHGTSNTSPAAVFVAMQNVPPQEGPLPPITQNNPIALPNSPTNPTREPAPLLASKQENPSSIPRLVFIGIPQVYPGFGGGAPLLQESQVLAYESAPESTPVPIVDPSLNVIILPAPLITVAKCADSLVSQECLITDSDVSFSWEPIDDAVYYAVNKNGTYATTTDTYLDANISDFSDYDFSLAAVGENNTTSATSTVRVSVASVPIAINEIAWMGTEDSSSDEWMELKNNTNYTINLANWSLASDDETPSLVLSGSIKPYGFVLLERTDDTTVRNVAADIVYSGSLKNSGEILRLAYASSTLDMTPSGAWTAGSNEDEYDRRSMERIAPREAGDNTTNWATWGSTIEFIRDGEGVDGATILGTPKARNSVNYVPLNNGEDIVVDTTLGSDSGYYIPYIMTVASSSILTVQEGVDILAREDLVVEGVISANGTEQNPVHFIGSLESLGGSRPQIFIENKDATSTFSHVVVEDLYGIVADPGNIVVKDSEFKNNEFGVVLFNGSTATITNTKFSTTTEGEVLSAYDGSVLTVASTTITDALGGGAIEVFEGSVLTVATTTINNVSWEDGIKVYEATASLSNVTVENVEHRDAINLTDSTTTISNTTIQHGGEDGVGILGGTTTITNSSISDFPNGAGVYVSDPTSPVLIQNTTISGTETPIESYVPTDVVVSP